MIIVLMDRAAVRDCRLLALVRYARIDTRSPSMPTKICSLAAPNKKSCTMVSKPDPEVDFAEQDGRDDAKASAKARELAAAAQVVPRL